MSFTIKMLDAMNEILLNEKSNRRYQRAVRCYHFLAERQKQHLEAMIKEVLK